MTGQSTHRCQGRNWCLDWGTVYLPHYRLSAEGDLISRPAIHLAAGGHGHVRKPGSAWTLDDEGTITVTCAMLCCATRWWPCLPCMLQPVSSASRLVSHSSASVPTPSSQPGYTLLSLFPISKLPKFLLCVFNSILRNDSLPIQATIQGDNSEVISVLRVAQPSPY